MEFSKRIKARRKQLGLSVSQVAKAIAEPSSSYIDWENGRKITGERVYPKLSRALKMSLSELITGGAESVEPELKAIEKSIEKIRLRI